MISVTPEKTNIASNKCNPCVTVIGQFSDPYFEYLLLAYGAVCAYVCPARTSRTCSKGQHVASSLVSLAISALESANDIDVLKNSRKSYTI